MSLISENGHETARQPVSLRGRAARSASNPIVPAGDPLERRTKIVATLGPATDRPGVLDELVDAGLDCARLNCSHGTSEQLLERARAVRAAAERAGRPVGLLFDLQGPKMRLSAATVERRLTTGEEMILTGAGGTDGVDHVVVDFPGFARLVTDRSEIVVGDGVPRFGVERIDGDRIMVRAISDGPLSANKGINVTYARPELPAITEKDIEDIALAAEAGADFVALSFVRSGADLEDLRSRLRALGSRAGVVAKIENAEGYEALDDIIAATDGVMVARGDYGVVAGLAGVPLMQKDTIARTTGAGKFVITATQMLESMISAPEPTRAEVADVANAVIDGTSAVMLSAESSVGSYPVEAVRAMALIASKAEESPVVQEHARHVRVAAGTPASAVMHAGVELADELGAAAIIVPTATGGAARACAKYRPTQPIVALTHDPAVADQLTLERGVYPVVVEAAAGGAELIATALSVGRDFAGLRSGQRIVLTTGPRPGEPGATNAITVRGLP